MEYIMNIICTLNSLSEGQSCRVTKLLSNGRMRSRLSDLGLVSGTSVKCLRKSLSGGIAAYLIRGAVIALRDADSSDIIVTPEERPGSLSGTI